MRNRIFLTCLLSTCIYAAPLSAEPLVINPTPTENLTLHDSLPIAVPQPGDAYFDPPSAQPQAQAEPVPEAAPQVSEAPPLEVFVSEEQEEIATIDISDMFSDAGSESAEDALIVNMSADPFEDMETETESAAELPQSKPPQEIQPSSGNAPEEITWNAPRFEPQVLEISNDGDAASDAEGADLVWSAPEGANINKVLNGWAREANVELISENQNTFAVLESFEKRGEFKGAVQGLLDQYQDNEVRPVATLHVDAENGKRTLVVRDFAE